MNYLSKKIFKSKNITVPASLTHNELILTFFLSLKQIWKTKNNLIFNSKSHNLDVILFNIDLKFSRFRSVINSNLRSNCFYELITKDSHLSSSSTISRKEPPRETIKINFNIDAFNANLNVDIVIKDFNA